LSNPDLFYITEDDRLLSLVLRYLLWKNVLASLSQALQAYRVAAYLLHTLNIYSLSIL